MNLNPDKTFSRSIISFRARPWLISLSLTALLAWLIPVDKNRLSVVLVKNKISEKSKVDLRIDLDHDGNYERAFFANRQETSLLFLAHQGGASIEQWNFNGTLPLAELFYTTGDITGDSIDEFFVFYHRNDSLFLLAIDAMKTKSLLLKDLFIDMLNEYDGEPECYLKKTKWLDSDRDGLKELYFIISAQYSLQPRNVYRVNFRNREVLKSPTSYVAIENFLFDDLNEDGKMEIMLSTNAPGNVHLPSAPFTDQKNWIVVLNEDLQFRFSPISVGQYPSTGFASVISVNGKNKILYLNYSTPDCSFKELALIMSSEGILEDSVSVTGDFGLVKNRILVDADNGQKPLFIDPAGNIHEFTHGKGFCKTGSLPEQCSFLQTLHIQGIKKPVWVFLNNQKDQLYFTTDQLRLLASFSLHETSKKPGKYDISRSENHLQLINLSPSCQLEADISGNPWFYLRFLMYFLLFGVLYLLVQLIKKRWENQVQKKAALERNLLQLQLSSLSSQLDPHLTFNLLNSISYVLLKHEGQEMHDSFTRLTNYIRNTLVNSDRLIVTLKDEIEFVEAYLALQKSRLGEKLNWSVLKDQDVPDNFEIPRMLVQNLVENSIKHGLRSKPEGGTIIIKIHKKDACILILVEDNGVGKNSLNKHSGESTGKGLSILHQFFDLLNHHNNEKASLELLFPVNENNVPLGARVEIRIPLNYKY